MWVNTVADQLYKISHSAYQGDFKAVKVVEIVGGEICERQLSCECVKVAATIQ